MIKKFLILFVGISALSYLYRVLVCKRQFYFNFYTPAGYRVDASKIF